MDNNEQILEQLFDSYYRQISSYSLVEAQYRKDTMRKIMKTMFSAGITVGISSMSMPMYKNNLPPEGK